MDVDDVRLRVEVILPDILEEHRARHDLSGVPHEVFQQQELARLQVDLLPAARGGARQEIKLQVTNAELRDDGVRAIATRQRIDARQQLGEGIGLGKIIIATDPQALHAVIDLAKRTEKQHRGLVAFLAHATDHRQAIHPGHHAVNDRDIVIAAHRQVQAILAVWCMVNDVTAFLEAAGEIGRSFPIVFNNENSHVHSVPVCGD